MAKKKAKQVEVDKYEHDQHGRIIGEKPEFRMKPGHHMGRTGKYGGSGNGYELHEDGSYKIAPADGQSIEEILSEIESIKNLMDSVWDHAQKQLKEVENRRAKWFSEMAKSLYWEGSLSDMAYHPSSGRVTFKPTVPPVNKALEERVELDKAGAGTGKE